MNLRQISRSLFAVLSLFFVTRAVASDFERVSRDIESLPKPLYQIRHNTQGLHHGNKMITVDRILKKIQTTPSLHLLLTEDKFTDMPKAEIKKIAEAVILSGGRFFHKKTRSSIDSIFVCVELTKRTTQKSLDTRATTEN